MPKQKILSSHCFESSREKRREWGSLPFPFFESKKMEDIEQTIEYFQRAIKVDGFLALVFVGLGVAYKFRGKMDEAISSWEKAAELNSNDYFLIYNLNLGIAHLEKGNKAQAPDYFHRYLSLRKGTLSSEEKQKIDALIHKCKQK